MDEQQIGEVHTVEKAAGISALENESDDVLRAMIAQARAILDGRASEQRRRALAEIKRLARENGLSVNINKPARKRGRPRKADTEF